MASTMIYRVNNPTPGVEYVAPAAYWIKPSPGTTITVEVKTYSSSNALQVVSTLKAIIRDVSSGSDRGSYTGSGGDDTVAVTSAPSGGDICTVAGVTGSACAYMLMHVTSYTGTPYASVKVRRSGAWVPVAATKVRRSGAWVAVPHVYVRRSGAWTQIV